MGLGYVFPAVRSRDGCNYYILYDMVLQTEKGHKMLKVYRNRSNYAFDISKKNIRNSCKELK